MRNIDKKIVEELFDKACRGSKADLSELEILAENDDAIALNKLSEIYLKGLGEVEQLPQKAMELLHKAAALDYPPALYRLGEFYYYGKGGLTVDARKAVEYLTRAAELGESDSYKLLGEIYFYNEGEIEANGYKVIDYLLKYAEAKQRQLTEPIDPSIKYEIESEIDNSLKTIQEIYLYGKCGVKQNVHKAIEYLIRDFEENDNYNSAQEVLQIYLYGCGEIKPDWRKAFEFANVPSGGGLEIYNDVDFKFVCVFDDELGYFRKDGQGTLEVLERHFKRLVELKAPDIIKIDKLKRIMEIYEEGYGGLAPNRIKADQIRKQISAIKAT